MGSNYYILFHKEHGECMNNTVNKNVVLLITTMSSFLAPFMGSSVFIGLPSIGKEFSMDVVMLSGYPPHISLLLRCSLSRSER